MLDWRSLLGLEREHERYGEGEEDDESERELQLHPPRRHEALVVQVEVEPEEDHEGSSYELHPALGWEREGEHGGKSGEESKQVRPVVCDGFYCGGVPAVLGGPELGGPEREIWRTIEKLVENELASCGHWHQVEHVHR